MKEIQEYLSYVTKMNKLLDEKNVEELLKEMNLNDDMFDCFWYSYNQLTDGQLLDLYKDIIRELPVFNGLKSTNKKDTDNQDLTFILEENDITIDIIKIVLYDKKIILCKNSSLTEIKIALNDIQKEIETIKSSNKLINYLKKNRLVILEQREEKMLREIEFFNTNNKMICDKTKEAEEYFTELGFIIEYR